MEGENEMTPQALYLYGTNKEDGSPNFGLFTWFTHCWDGEYKIMACIGEPKLTKDRILAEGKFSASLVTEALLPIADYMGNNSGYDIGKMDIPMNIGRGKVLDVPVLADSPEVYELEVTQRIPLADNSDIFICKIHNTHDASEADGALGLEEIVREYSPIISVGMEYFTLQPTSKGPWGQWKDLRNERVE